MKKMRKLQLAALLVGVSAAFAGFAVMNVKAQAQADGTGTFSMGKGAVIRTTPEESGMRWITTVTESWYNETVPQGAKVAFGTFVTSADNVSSVEELDENFNNGKKDIECPADAKFKDGTFTYYSSVIYNKVATEKQKAAYAEELVARSYVKYSTDNGTTWTYAYAGAEDSMRCIRVVAATTILDEETFASLPTDEDRNAVKAYVGENNGDLVGDGFLETAENDTFDASSYTTVYENYKQTSNAKTEFTIGEHYDYLYFDENGNFATARFQHVTKALDDEVEFQQVLLTNETGATLDGYYALAKDITLTGTWKNSMIFKGILDGNGYTVNGLSMSKKSGLFSAINGATVKNISIKDAALKGCETGVFAYQTAGTATFENVYVSLAGTTFSEYYTSEEQDANPIFVLDNRYGIGGLIAKTSKKVTVKDCVIYIPEHMTNASGFVAGYAKNSIDITNSTFIGGNGKIFGEYSDSLATVNKDNNTVICDAVKAYKALYGDDFDQKEKENANGWSNMQIASYEENHPLMVLNANNIADLASATSEIAVLTEDLNLKGASVTYFGGDNYFTGVFDGQNHLIVGIDANAKGAGGLFRKLAGSVKNVALDGTCTNHIGGNGGLVAECILGTTYLENVYLKPIFKSAACGAVGRMVGNAKNSHVSLSMKDVVIVVEKFSQTQDWIHVNGAVFAYGVEFGYDATASMGVYMENCYCVAPEERPVGWRDGAQYAVPLSSLDNNHKYFFWNIGDTVGGTTMTKDDGFTWYAPDRLQLFNARVQTGGIKLSDFLKERIDELTAIQ